MAQNENVYTCNDTNEMKIFVRVMAGIK